MRKIKVIHLVEDLKIGGLERVVATIAEGLDKEKYDVEVWCVARDGEIADELKGKGIKVKILGILTYHNPFNILRLVSAMRKANPDIIHTHGYFANTAGRLAGLLARIPIILAHLHSTYYYYKKRHFLIEKFLSLFTSKIICCSEAVKQFAVNYEKVNSNKLIIIYNGIDLQNFCQFGNLRETRKRLGLSDKEKVIGSVGRLKEVKGYKFLLEAATRVVKEIFGVKFLIIGDGSLREELEKLTKNLGLKQKVIFTGKQKDISELLGIMDIFVFPSLLEGLGIAAIEAMAFGLPIVATNVGGIPEIVNDRKSGFLVPPKDSHALAIKIIELLKDGGKAQKMGRIGKEIFEKKFTSKIMIREIERLYEEAIQNTLHIPFR
ncbi:MAG: glycosyltransferase [bacterium]